ncbi:hypothetical protein PGTUg99_007632 [Puccinia graminis f. sp. tritici]|uniref:Uncharacterized protein n=1 Tax=Puccinia graminis f. sp. tritici TaxID=56615 RepID=A0A5B0RA00_PUCGR|nr:hypothetical protein PGTUg99_007632 [Puccinia graminis f. sp. tritici]
MAGGDPGTPIQMSVRSLGWAAPEHHASSLSRWPQAMEPFETSLPEWCVMAWTRTDTGAAPGSNRSTALVRTQLGWDMSVKECSLPGLRCTPGTWVVLLDYCVYQN